MYLPSQFIVIVVVIVVYSVDAKKRASRHLIANLRLLDMSGRSKEERVE